MNYRQYNARLLAIWKKIYAAAKNQLDNFNDTNLSNQYADECRILLKETDKLAGVTACSKPSAAVRRYIKKWSGVLNNIRSLEIQKEEAKCTQPKPGNIVEIIGEFDMKGDIVITDPCYIDEWINPDNTQFTLYGDWSCSLWKCDPDTMRPGRKAKPFGHFAADSARVSVTCIDKCDNRCDIEKFVEERPDLACIVKRFDGKVCYEKHTTWYAYNGKWYRNEYLIVTGHGKPFCFTSAQTGF